MKITFLIFHYIHVTSRNVSHARKCIKLDLNLSEVWITMDRYVLIVKVNPPDKR
jgi:hypothetical protein